MLLLIHLGVIIFLIGLCIHYNLSTHYSASERAFFSGAGAVLLIFVMVAAWTGSYSTYTDLKVYKDGEILKHDMKALSAVSQTINGDNNLIAETKDGYYEGLVNGIYAAKNRVKWYNETIIKKKIYGFTLI